MTELWKPKAPRRTKWVERDMRKQARPNPYYLTEDDVGGWMFGARITEKDVGLRCQLVWNDARDGVVFQVENYEQRDARLKVTTEEKVAFINRTLREQAAEYIGKPVAKETIETAMSDAIGMPVRLSDYNPETQAYETVEVCLPQPVQYIELDLVLTREDPE